jgi:Tol biopolymer transport system component
MCGATPRWRPCPADRSLLLFARYIALSVSIASSTFFWSMDLSGGDRQRIGPCCVDPNVSPNGRRLSFLTNNGQPGGTALFTSSIDGSNLFQVTPFSFNVAVKQDCAPDGRRLVFTQNGDVLMPGVSANIATIRPVYLKSIPMAHTSKRFFHSRALDHASSTGVRDPARTTKTRETGRSSVRTNRLALSDRAVGCCTAGFAVPCG